MPLARIITNVVDDSLELTMQLRARGFRVETVTPGNVPATPADLVVQLEECASEDVVASAAAEPNGNLWVFVAPGALDERARPVRVISLVPAGSDRARPSTKVEKVASGELLPFPPLEDDPILSELASDVILAEQKQPALPTGTSGIPSFVTVPLHEKAAADVSSSPSTTASLEVVRIPDLNETLVAKAPIGTPLVAAEAKVAFSIPRVPDPVAIPVVIPQKEAQEPRSAVYKISFQTGPRFWRSAWVSAALVVLVGILAVIVGTHPHLAGVSGGSASAQGNSGFSPGLAPASTFAKPGFELDPASDAGSIAPSSPTAAETHAAQAEAPKKQNRHSASADDIIAEDTVVFYDRPHRGPSPKVAAQAHTRKYSD